MNKFQDRRMERSDERAVGGNLCNGWRTVKKGGIIKFDGMTFKDNSLKRYEGDRVWIEFDGASPFANGPINVFKTIMEWKICTIDLPI